MAEERKVGSNNRGDEELFQRASEAEEQRLQQEHDAN